MLLLAKIVEQLHAIEPEKPFAHTARMLLLLAQSYPDELGTLTERAALEDALRTVQVQLQSACDQESAVAEELNELAATRPAEFSPSHVWTLIRAIKVQKQILDLYQVSETAEVRS